MALATISNLKCTFCGLTQAATQPHCIGCGAGLPLKTGELEANRKLLDLATQVNTLLSRDYARERAKHKLTHLRFGIAFLVLGSILWGGAGYWLSYDDVMTAEQARVDRAANDRYTRILEMELHNQGNGMRPERFQNVVDSD